MVDLVKIRKKAKKQQNAAEEAREPSSVSAAVSSQEEAPQVAAVKASRAPVAAQAAPVPHKEPRDESGTPNPAPEGPSKLERFMVDAGKRRDAVVAAAAIEGVEDTTTLELLTFVIAGEHYAVDIDHIIEIVRPRPLTRIPNADASIVGIVSLRGTIVTLVDARLRLGHSKSTEETEETRTVVVDREHETLGFTVDSVLRVVKVAADTVEPHPVVHSSEQHEAIRGVFRVANALTILLDLDKLLDHKALSSEGGTRNSRLVQR